MLVAFDLARGDDLWPVGVGIGGAQFVVGRFVQFCLGFDVVVVVVIVVVGIVSIVFVAVDFRLFDSPFFRVLFGLTFFGIRLFRCFLCCEGAE